MIRYLPIALLAAGLSVSCGTEAEPESVTAPNEVLAAVVPEPAAVPAEAELPAAELPVEPETELDPWSPTRAAAFDELLADAGMAVELPAGFHMTPGGDNPALPYETALVHETGRLEVRLSLRPISKLELHFNDPHSAAPEPNHIFGMMFRAVVEQLSPTGIGIESELAPVALEPYGASWGALVVVDLRPEVAGGIPQGILLALHLEDSADAYALFLPSDLKEDRALIESALRCLRYAEQPPLPPTSQPTPKDED